MCALKYEVKSLLKVQSSTGGETVGVGAVHSALEMLVGATPTKYNAVHQGNRTLMFEEVASSTQSTAVREHLRIGSRNLKSSLQNVHGVCYGRGSPLVVRGETRVVSMASWAPWNNGRPLAMTSMRRLSMRSTDGRLRSERRVLVETRAPASRHTRAAARSRGQPRFLRTPDQGHTERWSPRGSRTRRHRQVRSVRGSGRRSRRSMRSRNKWLG